MDGLSSFGFGELDEPISPLATKRLRSAGDSLCTIRIVRQAPRHSNHRLAPRRPMVGELATVRFRGYGMPATLLNLSSTGAMIESEIDAFIGELIDIEIGDDAPMPAIVRWANHKRFGIEFGAEAVLLGQRSRQDFSVAIGAAEDDEIDDAPAAPPPAEPPPDEPAREPRQSVIRRAMVRVEGRQVPVRLCNISSHGAMLESDHKLLPGAVLELELAGHIIVSGKVRWNNGRKAGLHFDAALRTDGLASLKIGQTGILRPTYLDSEFDTTSPWAARFDRLTIQELNAPAQD